MSIDDVTDNAVICYLERVYGVDVKGIRRRIADITEEGRENEASAVNSKGVRYSLAKGGRVYSVRGVNGELSRRAQRWHRRRK